MINKRFFLSKNSDPRSSTAFSLQFRYLLIVLSIIPLLFCLDGQPLLEGDEAIYASLARDIVENHHWLNPHIDHRAWFDKPPLTLWVQAIAMRFLGLNLVSFRLPAVVIALVCALLLYLLARKLMDKNSTLFVVPLFLLSPGIYASARDFKFDLVFILGQILVLTGLCQETFQPKEKPLQALKNAAFIASGVTISFLSKGLAGLVLPTGAWIIYAILMRDLRQLLNRYVIGGLALGFVLIMIYLIPMAHFYGQPFIDEQLLFSQINRIRQDYTANMNIPPLFYFHTFLWAALPSALVAYGLFGRWLWNTFFTRQKPHEIKRIDLPHWQILCFAWGISYFTLFGLARSKLPHYIFPVIPAACLLTAYNAEKIIGQRIFSIFSKILILLFTITVTLFSALAFPDSIASWICCIIFIGLAFISLFSEDARKPFFLALVAAAIWYCGVLNKELGHYKPSPRVVELLHKNNISGDYTLGIMGWPNRPLQFYRPVTNIRSANLVEAKEILDQGGLIFCEQSFCQKLQAQIFDVKTSPPIEGFPVQAITWRFLNLKTRKNQLREFHILSRHHEFI